ncbi:MAG TPA: hypothetical protein VFS00_35265, partial [Polyangiaceae bacterium]|nr:hypothetical protein [Polyangiaceae bacterium]
MQPFGDGGGVTMAGDAQGPPTADAASPKVRPGAASASGGLPETLPPSDASPAAGASPATVPRKGASSAAEGSPETVPPKGASSEPGGLQETLPPSD